MVLIKTIPEMNVIGVKGKCNMATTMKDVPPIWNKLMARHEKITNKVNPKVCYGICTHIDKEHFWNLSCYEVDSIEEVPEKLIGEKINSMKIAVFEHKGKIETMAGTYEKIMNELAPKEKLEIDWSKPCIEMYDERFDESSDESICEIWIPIK